MRARPSGTSSPLLGHHGRKQITGFLTRMGVLVRVNERCSIKWCNMLEVLQFIFSSGWIFLGVVILIGAIGNSLHSIFHK